MTLDDDKSDLLAFTHKVYKWLNNCHEGSNRDEDHQHWRVIYPLRALQSEAKLAWSAFQERQSFESMVVLIREANEVALYNNGLYGHQLKYKLSLLQIRAEQASRGSIRAVEKFLDIIDLIMDSLLDALGIGEAIKELIKALRNQIR